MGLTVGVAIVTAAEVAGETHEEGLANMDVSADGATLSAAMISATAELVRRIRSLGYDPLLVDARTVTDLKAAAAFYTLYSIFTSRPNDESQKKAAAYKARFEEQIKNVVVTTTNEDARAGSRRGMPRVINHDSSWGPGWGPRDTTVPGAEPRPDGWIS